ncbi:TorD/DmsD family molecular chaperone [Endozoicomonas arenosclerae]|uniref:TorD/DmsD family molecular chaperone n=1 Tax=Endozoicomonas arenosclerae TaxID=1633495 RepID=UPI0007850098|nr:molecular chaperone [Endozoicomonas arenosclerae]
MIEHQTQQLAGLHIASQFFYRLFHQSPDPIWIESLKQESLLQYWPLDLDPADQSLLDQFQQSLETDIKILANDYADLFVGPDKLLAAPWASVYLTEEQINCGQPTQLVKAFYREFGIEIDTGETEPEDHIGLMFAFLAHLTQEALAAAESNDQTIESWITACRAFLENHLLTWAPRFLELVQEHAKTDFYRDGGRLCTITLQQFADFTDAEYKIVRLFR